MRSVHSDTPGYFRGREHFAEWCAATVSTESRACHAHPIRRTDRKVLDDGMQTFGSRAALAFLAGQARARYRIRLGVQFESMELNRLSALYFLVQCGQCWSQRLKVRVARGLEHPAPPWREQADCYSAAFQEGLQQPGILPGTQQVDRAQQTLTQRFELGGIAKRRRRMYHRELLGWSFLGDGGLGRPFRVFRRSAVSWPLGLPTPGPRHAWFVVHRCGTGPQAPSSESGP